jgi:hypothetical protein
MSDYNPTDGRVGAKRGAVVVGGQAVSRRLVQIAAGLFVLFVVAFVAAVVAGMVGAPGELLAMTGPVLATLFVAAGGTALVALLAGTVESRRPGGDRPD